ncbi:Putative LOC100123278, partial [Caligus rogercresseyi]
MGAEEVQILLPKRMKHLTTTKKALSQRLRAVLSTEVLSRLVKFESALEDLTSKGALDHFGSLDSSDTFHSFSSGAAPFPSQGSLARLEEMAAHGSMFTVDKKPSESRCRKPGRAAGRSVSTDMELDSGTRGSRISHPNTKERESL